jgi:gentisate 1,2-dioxygenase
MNSVHEATGTLQEELAGAGLAPLWMQGPDLMPPAPSPRAVPHLWRWSDVWPLVQRVGAQITVGEAAERRAIAFANPGLDGQPYATPTLWAAVQYLAPGESAPSHRHTQGAFRFILSGEGAATSVDGDVVAMTPGDVVLTPAWAWHEHRSLSSAPTMWLDGLDIPLVRYLDAGFQEQGGVRASHPWEGGPSRSERLWGHPGLFPRVPGGPAGARLLVYRWAETEAALATMLELQRDGLVPELEKGHASVRFQDPSTGGDPLPTMRLEMHRLLAGASVTFRRRTGSSVWQVFHGKGSIVLAESQHVDVVFGDLVTVPSWASMTIQADEDLDVFSYNDAPIYEALHLEAPAGVS